MVSQAVDVSHSFSRAAPVMNGSLNDSSLPHPHPSPPPPPWKASCMVSKIKVFTRRMFFVLLRPFPRLRDKLVKLSSSSSPPPGAKPAPRTSTSSLANSLLGTSFTILLTIFVSYITFQINKHQFVPGSSHRSATATAGLPISTHSLAKLQASLSTSQVDLHLEEALSEFFIPPSLSRKIPIPCRYHLLTRLQVSKHPVTGLPRRVFFLHVVGKNANSRFDAISAAITYAYNSERILVILWDTQRGTSAYGSDALTSARGKDRYNVLLSSVDSLRLSPNLTHWTEYQINYYTAIGQPGHIIDKLAALTSRHIFYRTEGRIDARYGASLPGVMLMPKVLRPGPPLHHAWFAYIKHWAFPHLDNSEVTDLLNRVYSVPFVFLEGMSDPTKRMLLRELDISSSKRAFFVHAQYGLGNRLRALGSAMAVARVTGRVLVLVWEPDVHLDCRFSDLFVNQLIVLDKLNMNWPPRFSATKDSALAMVDFFNFMRHDRHQVRNPLKELVNPRNGRHVYVKTAYVVRSSLTPRIISTTSWYWRIMREELLPREEVMTLVDDPLFENIASMVGVHVRARTIENDIQGVSEEFYGSGSQTTDHWRRLTGLKAFETKMMRLSLRYKYFVAADTREAIRALEKKFGPHRIFSLPRDQECRTRDVECAKLALADILLLSKVPALLGSHWSSFTEGAVRLSGKVKVLLAGVHFGRHR